ncbi:MAG: D-aminoacyl-tRNA deacylase [Bifidobacterium sp.]|uniref:D-aminoacyl-tRNA deacylase n=1 Tax=Bifidobacterium sp. TaxID=41200 RepID=UPI0039ECBCB3
MRVVLQRVASASVSIVAEHGEVSDSEPQRIEAGLMLLVGVSDEDDDDAVTWMAHKISKLRIFEDEDMKMNRSIEDVGGEILSISQFTLYGDANRGNRPSFVAAGRPEHAERIWNQLNQALRSQGIAVRTGRFGAHMKVSLVNDGPVTLILER